MKFRIILYVIIAMAWQVVLGQLTGQGQGGIGMLTFIVMVELDPRFSFTYLVQNNEKKEK